METVTVIEKFVVKVKYADEEIYTLINLHPTYDSAVQAINQLCEDSAKAIEYCKIEKRYYDADFLN